MLSAQQCIKTTVFFFTDSQVSLSSSIIQKNRDEALYVHCPLKLGACYCKPSCKARLMLRRQLLPGCVGNCSWSRPSAFCTQRLHELSYNNCSCLSSVSKENLFTESQLTNYISTTITVIGRTTTTAVVPCSLTPTSSAISSVTSDALSLLDSTSLTPTPASLGDVAGRIKARQDVDLSYSSTTIAGTIPAYAGNNCFSSGPVYANVCSCKGVTQDTLTKLSTVRGVQIVTCSIF